MKKTIIATTTAAFTAIASLVAVSNAAVSSADPVSTPTPSVSASTAPSPSPTPTPVATPRPTPTPAPSATYAPGMSPGEHGGWAIVDPTTGRQTGGVIVCTPEVCGSGWFAGMRVVLQTLQDPAEAARSANGVGNVAGYSGGSYNFTSGQWTMPGANGTTLEIPLAYPDANNRPTCVAACPAPTPTPTPTVTLEPSASPEPTPTIPVVTTGRITNNPTPALSRPTPNKGKTCPTRTTTKTGVCIVTNANTGAARASTIRTVR